MELTYVIYLVDGNGDEFFVDQNNELIRLMATERPDPLLVKSFFQINAHLARLRNKYPATCRLFALERSEFTQRQNQ